MTRAGLLSAIAANPDEDAPRLVFADWLDEFGDDLDRAHAEYIRVQIALERLPPGDDRWAELDARENQLAARRWYIRERMGNPRCIDWRFAGGFPCGVGFDWNDKRKGRLDDDDLADMAAVIDRLPIRSFVGDVLGSGTAPQLPPIGRSGLELLAAWPHLARLTALEATTGFTPYEDRGDFAPGLRALGESPYAGGLRRLRLGGWQVNTDALAAAVSSPNLSRLTDLSVSLYGGPAVVEALALLPGTPLAARLERLSFVWVNVPAAAVRACLDRGKLRSLSFGIAEDDAAGVGPLLGSPGLLGLRELHITGDDHGFDTDESPSGMTDCRDVWHLPDLLASPALWRLETLSIRGVSLGDEGVHELVGRSVGRSLIELNVEQCGLSGAGLRALRPLLAEGRLRRLSIDHNEITRADAEELASWPEFGRLHRLNVGFFNHLGDEGRAALEQSPHRHPWLRVM